VLLGVGMMADEAMPAALEVGAEEVQFGAPLMPTAPGTDRYADER
jgi:hypothetical protein